MLKNSLEQLKFTNDEKLPVILQTEAAECGLACLAMVAGYHGYNTDLISLRMRFPISQHGLNLQQLMNIANKINLTSRAVQLKIEEIDQLQTPCILHWDMKHFVVLRSIKKNKYFITDPSSGERTYSAEQFSKHFTGIALELRPAHGFEQKTEKKHIKISSFWDKIFGLKRTLGQVILLSLILQAFILAAPFYVQTIVDDVLLRNDTSLLLILAIGFFFIMVMEVSTSTLRSYFILHLSTSLSVQMASNLFRHLLHLPISYFENRHMGDIVSRFGSLNSIKHMLTSGFIAGFIDSIMAIITFILMLFYSVKMTLVVFIFVILYALVRTLSYKPLKILTEESIVGQAKQSTNFMESVRAIQSIKIFQNETVRQNLWMNKYADAANCDIKLARWNINYNLINNFLFGLENVLVIYLLSQEVITNVMTLGMFYAFITYKQQFVGKMQSLINLAIEFRMLNLHLERLSDIVLTKPEADLSSHQVNKEVISGSLEIKNVSFHYGENEPDVIKSTSFTINAGESVAIVGPSGCGKTTLIKIMMGLLTPSEGSVLCDDKNINTIESYRSQICGVMQNDQLISGSILENIAFGESVMDLDRAKECAISASIHDDINKMAMQYNTLIGDMGSSLSGGQKQRILLARALYRQPKILFLDEATSHLDLINEKNVNEHIKKLNVTRVIVAHRPETIASADRVIYLNADDIPTKNSENRNG